MATSFLIAAFGLFHQADPGIDHTVEDIHQQHAEDKIVRIAISSDPGFGFNAIGDSLMATNGLLREGLTRYGDGVLVGMCFGMSGT